MKNLLKNTITEQVEKDKQWETEQTEKLEQETQAKEQKEKQEKQLLMIAGVLVAISIIGVSIIVIKNKKKN